MVIYQTGETIRVSAAITDSTGAAANPTTTVISIAKPDGTLAVDGIAMIYSEDGSYYYDYVISSSAGIYKVQIKGNTKLHSKKP